MVLMKTLLIGTRKTLSQPENWTKRCNAIDKDGIETYACNSNAVSFCLGGAFIRECEKHHPGLGELHSKYYNAFEHLVINKTNSIVTSFNDHDDTTHKNVLDVLDKLIEEDETA